MAEGGGKALLVLEPQVDLLVEAAHLESNR